MTSDFVEFVLHPLPLGPGKPKCCRRSLISMLIGLAALMGSPLSIHSARAGNILNNPGFEADPAGQSQTIVNWTWYGASSGNTLNETGAPARSGTNYFKVFGQFTTSTNYSGVYQDSASAAGAVYSADGWAYSASSDGGGIHGQDMTWLEVTFRDVSNNVLALHRSDVVTGANIASYGGLDAWLHLPITNKCSFTNSAAIVVLPGAVTNASTNLVAPPGTAAVRYQIVFAQGPDNANGSAYFDDCNLNQTGGTPVPPTAWNIVWSDEFNGTTINPRNWTFETGNNNGWGNNELEYYTSSTQNAYVSNGLLHIVARQQAMGGRNYTSARMKTQGLFSKTFGRFEFRAKLPAGVGFWPALWMLGTNIASVGWPGCGEIDVTENNGGVLNKEQGSIHSGSDATLVYTFPNGESVTNFHTYLLEWTTDAVKWYVDNNLYYYESQTSWTSSVGSYPTPFNQPFFIIMNLAVGGNYLGNPSTNTINANSTFPGDMQVDYVRVYDQTAPMQITPTLISSNTWRLTWPTNIVCHLQAQTNSAGLTTNWVDLAGSTSPFVVPLSRLNASVFYRLASP
jgi:beta-glucanase (GH16 family)